ncbi:hypothetical protein Cantr_02243 [Candida viswanathii]|uniref:Uncharacterized protein n=1 Tax=Candida viswanathii TaxID=5486 RepID=A0A367YPD2_9ASCO|nr:hypothetical protein Cantr_02243 [Candida viswanathii]
MMPRVTTSSSSSTSPEKSNTTTTTLSSLDGSNSSPASNNRICQWYCCSCGQSYGTVLYKDDYNHPLQPMGEPEANRATTLDSANYTLDNIKYYSQVVYRDHKHVLSSGGSHNESNNSPTNYFNCKDRTMSTSSATSDHHPIPASSTSSTSTAKHRHDSIDNHSPESPSFMPQKSNHILSPLNIDLNDNLIDYQEKIILNIPTRFTCHRCSHMMCPYCPKLRLKDLH